MKKSMIPLLIAAVMMMIGLAGCEKAAETRTVGNAQTGQQGETQPATAAASSAEFTGKVVETMDAGGYTYVHLDNGSEQLWAAGPVTPIEVGQELHVAKSMPMKDFHSKALEKDFDVIYFVGSFAGHAAGSPHGGMGDMGGATGGDTQGGMGGMGDGSSHTSVDPTEVAKVAKADYTVEEIFAKGGELGGKPVKVRGQVVKQFMALKDNPDLNSAPRTYWAPNDLAYMENQYMPELFMMGLGSKFFCLTSPDTIWDKSRAPEGKHTVLFEEYTCPTYLFSRKEWRQLADELSVVRVRIDARRNHIPRL